MELKWKKPQTLPEGQYIGEIVRIQYTEKPHHYTNIYVKVDSTDIELNYSCPTVLSDKSRLGKLLIEFGVKPSEDETFDPEKILIGRKVTFLVVKESAGEDIEYTKILMDTLKPIN